MAILHLLLFSVNIHLSASLQPCSSRPTEDDSDILVLCQPQWHPNNDQALWKDEIVQKGSSMSDIVCNVENNEIVRMHRENR